MIPPSGPVPARIMLVGEAPGETEMRRREPFVGASGQLLNEMLHEAGLMRSECFLTNVARLQPPGNDIELWIPKVKKNITQDMVPLRDKMVKPVVKQGWDLLCMEIDMVKPNIIVALGNVSLWALTGKWGIKAWRGSLLSVDGLSCLQSPKVIPVYHPAYIMRDWSARAISVQDLRRVKQEIATEGVTGTQYSFLLRPSYSSAMEYLDGILQKLQAVGGASEQGGLPTDSRDEQGQSTGVERPLLQDHGEGSPTGTRSETPVRAHEVYRANALGNGDSAGEWSGHPSAEQGEVASNPRDEAKGHDAEGDSKGDRIDSVHNLLALPETDQIGSRNDQVSPIPSLTISVDIETRSGHIACVGLALDKVNAICLPFMCVERPAGYWLEEEEFAIIKCLRQVLTHPNAAIVGQNFIYDTQYFYRHWGFVPRFNRDTMLSHHCCFTTLPKGLDYLSSMYCERHVYWKAEGKNWDRKTGEDQLWAYNCKDAVITFECDEGIQATVDRLGMRTQSDFQQAMFWPVLQAMVRGVRVDEAKRAEFALELQDEISQREQWFIDVLGHPLNPRSPLQMKHLFYEDLRQKEIYSRSTGNITLDDEALQKIGAREPILRPLVRRINEYRSLGVFLSTFVGAKLDRDHRLRCSYNIAGTSTLRLSSSKDAFASGLNLQNIPAGGDASDDTDALQLPNVKTLFIPDPGYTFFDGDLDRADLQVVAWEAQDEDLKAALRGKVDIHLHSARAIYNLPISDDELLEAHPNFREIKSRYAVQRQNCKSIVHATNYIGSARTVAAAIGLSIHEVDRFQRRWFEIHPGIKRWHIRVINQLKTKKYVENRFGFRRYSFDRIDSELPEAIAWIPQSTVGHYINRIWLEVYHRLPDVQILLQVHDSLAGQYPSGIALFCKEQMQGIASRIVVPYDDPLVIPLSLKTSIKSWGDCK